MGHPHANNDWDTSNDKGKVGTWEQVNTCVLMDIRAELRKLNALLCCPNFLTIPPTLRRIAKNTTRKRKVVARAK